MEKGRHVDKEEALRYTASITGVHHLTSAKSGAGVTEAFTELLKRIVAKKKAAAARAPAAGPQRQTVIIVDDEAPRPKGGCC
jgi:hypothetical protein